nr:ATP-binding cassette sub-family G member 4-like isoform X1 [Onthophagus taurus]
MSCVDIKFENIVYPKLNRGTANQEILKNLSGCFYSGQLTGILGGSGAGKTTLINLLSGHITTNIQGKVSINDAICSGADLKNSSIYLMDDDLLQTSLTVKESLLLVAELKLDKRLSASNKIKTCLSIVEKLNLTSSLNTMTENLSGGEKRRLSIALELISDPPIIFMDEPTSGLDEVSAKNTIDLLRSLSRDGKTIICTIHQPSNIIFNMLEHVYFINDGRCIYDGTVNGLVPFLDNILFPCPKNYNPADYILEMSQNNEEISLRCNSMLTPYQFDREKRGNKEIVSYGNLKSERRRIGFLKQTGVLLKRHFIQTKRRKLAMGINVAHHILCGLMTGFLYVGTGNDAAKTANIYKLSLGAVAYISFAYAIIPILVYPFQIKIIKREISNDWYGLKAYFLTQSLAPLPYMIPLCFLFTISCFGIVDSSLSLERYSRLSVILIGVAIVSHFYGHTIGAIFNAKNACVIGSMVATIAMNIGSFHHYRISFTTWVIRQTTFTRYGVTGCLLTFYQNRKLNCSEIVCRHSVEKLIYDDFGVGIPSYLVQLSGLVVNVICYAICFYVILRIKFYSNLVEVWRNFKAKLSK